MKFRFKRTLLFSITSCSLIIICWNAFAYYEKFENPHKSLPSGSKYHRRAERLKPAPVDTSDGDNSISRPYAKSSRIYKTLECLINEEYTIKCVKGVDSSVYVPFTFIRKYFEIGGRLTRRHDGKEYFSWQHSYSKIYTPKDTYDFKGPFLWFENYNVEVRERVKLISAIHGVPVSTQWDINGHFYPIQVAQFGLSHHSKNLTGGRPRVLTLETGEFNVTNWQLEVRGNSFQIKSINDEELKPSNKVLFIEGESVAFKIKKRKSHNDLTLSLKLKPLDNFTLSVVLQSDGGSEYVLSYSTKDYDVFDEQEITYGIGADLSWKHLTRDLGVDLQKAYLTFNKKLGVKAKNLRVLKVVFSGKALIDDVTLSSSAHESHFKAAVSWLMKNQDANGGWSIKVTRKLSNGALVLKPGWYSAMAQGQAISLLTRMYHFTGDDAYLNAAKKAQWLFTLNSTHNGVRTYFMDKYVWYEEYPTVPSSYVLNGFIYALFGLYDLKMSCPDHCADTHKLFDDGIESLKTMLPLYDTGSGSLYDLRHFSLGVAPNIARWDYHATHINQLAFLSTIDETPLFQTTVKRWISYMKGKRAPHN